MRAGPAPMDACTPLRLSARAGAAATEVRSHPCVPRAARISATMRTTAGAAASAASYSYSAAAYSAWSTRSQSRRACTLPTYSSEPHTCPARATVSALPTAPLKPLSPKALLCAALQVFVFQMLTDSLRLREEYHFDKMVADTFLENHFDASHNTFESIRRVADIYEWGNNVLIPGLFANAGPCGSSVGAPGHFSSATDKGAPTDLLAALRAKVRASRVDRIAPNPDPPPNPHRRDATMTRGRTARARSTCRRRRRGRPRRSPRAWTCSTGARGSS